MGAVCDRSEDTTYETFVHEGVTAEGSVKVGPDVDKTLLVAVQPAAVPAKKEPEEKVVVEETPAPVVPVVEAKPEPKPEPPKPEPEPVEIPPSDTKAEPKPEESKPEPPKKKLVIEFSENGQKKEVEFVSKPLGIVYSDKMPDGKMKVKRLSQNSLAGTLGVNPGMKFEKIDGKDVSGKRFSEIQGLIEEAAADLPTA